MKETEAFQRAADVLRGRLVAAPSAAARSEIVNSLLREANLCSADEAERQQRLFALIIMLMTVRRWPNAAMQLAGAETNTVGQPLVDTVYRCLIAVVAWKKIAENLWD